MRFVRFAQGDQIHLGIRHTHDVLDLTAAARNLYNEYLGSVTQLMEKTPSMRIGELLTATERDGIYRHDIHGLQLDAPIRDVPKLLALAGNFPKHVQESGFRPVTQRNTITPQVFCKPSSTTINRPGGLIQLRGANRFLDWEVELAVVIGKRGRDIGTGEAMSYIFGYTVINDVSERQLNCDRPARTVREFDPFFDWLAGKWFDGSAPMGPELVTTEEIGDPHDLKLRLILNGEVMQSSNTSQMIFDIPQTISYISSILTLEPGDVIAMGTPDGVGKARGVRLRTGDVMQAEIDGIGRLETQIVEVEP